MTEEHQPANRWKSIQLTLLVWVAMIGVDFFLHGGLFAQLYEQDSPFILSAEDAFRRIPLGYLALLATVVLLVWIVKQTSVRGWKKGLVLGLVVGAVMAASSTLGLYSISTASAQLLAAWFIAQVIQITIAGAIIGQGLLVQSLRKLTVTVVIGFVLLFAATVVIQNTGFTIID
jgi:hypothetical protein